MGIVKISDRMHEDVRVASQALCRSINAQAEHWMRIGMLSELYPSLDHAGLCRLLIRLEQAGGLDLASLARQSGASMVAEDASAGAALQSPPASAVPHSPHLPHSQHVLSATS